jgi:hypothetical protein
VDNPSWVTEDVDLDRPSVARVYDYFLGGSHNFAVDRAMAAQLEQVAPDIGELMRANRAFLRRSVRFMVSIGVKQFLDLGSGIPTVGNVHEIAQRADPATRTVYVDIDPVAVAHSRAMLEGVEGTAVVRGDLRDPGPILSSPEVAKLLDFSQPIGLLIVSVLHFLPDADNPQAAVAEFRAAMPSGSHLAMSHVARDLRVEETQKVIQLYQQTGSQNTARTPDEITAFFGDFELVEPGLVFLPQWRPDSSEDAEDHPERFLSLAGVGQKP